MARKILIKASKYNAKVADEHKSFTIVKITSPKPTDAVDLGRKMGLKELETYIRENNTFRGTVVELSGD